MKTRKPTPSEETAPPLGDCWKPPSNLGKVYERHLAGEAAKVLRAEPDTYLPTGPDWNRES